MLVYVQGIEKNCSDELSLYEPKRPFIRSSYAGHLYTVSLSVGRKEVSVFNFAIKGPRLWNSLPMDLRQAHPLWPPRKDWRHTYSIDIIIPEAEHTIASTGYKIKKGAIEIN